MNKIKEGNFFPTLLSPAQGCGWAEPLQAAQGARWEPTLDRIPFHQRWYSNIYSHSRRLKQLRPELVPIRPIHLTCTSLVCGRKETRVLRENPHRHGRTCKLHTESGPSQDSFFCINITKWCWTKTSLFEDLMCIKIFLSEQKPMLNRQ